MPEPPVNDAAEFSCEVTGFDGYQDAILGLRNSNRERPETLDYLSWRYRFTADAPEPRVFWLLRSGGERIGMAAAIFRPYLLNGQRVATAVVGDISVDARWRGRGLGRLLLRYMTEYLDQHFPTQPAFVIPTESARRSLASVGWSTSGKLVPYVYVLDATPYLRALIHNQRLARLIAGCLTHMARMFTRSQRPEDGALFVGDRLDERVVEFATSIPCPSGAVRDLGPESLTWRYAQHPHIRFTFGRYYASGEMRGLVVFEDDPLSHICSVYEVAAKTPADARGMLALLVLRGMTYQQSSVRMVVNDRHPLSKRLRGLGFIARRADSVFQVHSRSGDAECASWCVTQGDKDT